MLVRSGKCRIPSRYLIPRIEENLPSSCTDKTEIAALRATRTSSASRGDTSERQYFGSRDSPRVHHGGSFTANGMAQGFLRPRPQGFILTAADWTAQRGPPPVRSTSSLHARNKPFSGVFAVAMFARARETRIFRIGEGPFPSRSFTALWRNCNGPLHRPAPPVGIKSFHDAAESKCTGFSPRIFAANCVSTPFPPEIPQNAVWYWSNEEGSPISTSERWCCLLRIFFHFGGDNRRGIPRGCVPAHFRTVHSAVTSSYPNPLRVDSTLASGTRYVSECR